MSNNVLVRRGATMSDLPSFEQRRLSLQEIAEACVAIDRTTAQSLETLILMDALASDYRQNRGLYQQAVRDRVLAAQQVQTEIDRGRADEARYARRLHELEIERIEMDLEADRNPHHARHIYVERAAQLKNELQNAKEELDLANHELRQKKKDLAGAYTVLRRQFQEAESLPEAPAAPAYERHFQTPRPFGGRPR
jgi:ribosomal protein L29